MSNVTHRDTIGLAVALFFSFWQGLASPWRNASTKPSFAASFNRKSFCVTARISPERPISPKIAISAGTGVALADDIRAAATAKSAAGSWITAVLQPR